MSCDTKGFVLTPCKDVMLLAGVVERALNRFVLDEAKLQFPDCRGMLLTAPAREKFRLPKAELSADSDLVQFHFLFDGEKRTLWMFFGTDCDREDFGPHSISLSLGQWGRSDTILQLALHALSFAGPAYVNTAQGLADESFQSLQESRASYLDLLALHYVSCLRLEKFVQLWDSPLRPDDVTADMFFGAPEAVVREWVARENYSSAWDEMTAMARQRKVILNVMNEFHEGVCT